MVELEDHLAENLKKEKSAKKKNTGNSKAMNGLRQKLKKLAKQYADFITAYKQVNFIFSFLKTLSYTFHRIPKNS